VFLSAWCVAGAGLATTNRENSTSGRGIYKYDEKKIESFLTSIGHEGEIAHYIKRNSDGSALVFILGNDKVAIIASCAGTVERVKLPGSISWINDALKVVTWSDLEYTYFAGARKQKGIIIPYYLDPTGKYFVRPPRASGGKLVSEMTEIFATTHPDAPMARIHMKDANARLFLQGDKLLLIGHSPWNHNVIEIHVFELRRNTLVHVGKKLIIRPRESPAPFLTIDASPWDDSVLVLDASDIPLRSKWYVYRMGTNQLQHIGRAARYGFYLQCDPLLRVRDAIKRPRE